MMGFWSNLFNNAEKGFSFYQTYKTFKRELEDLWTDIKSGDGNARCRAEIGWPSCWCFENAILGVVSTVLIFLFYFALEFIVKPLRIPSRF
ncbi:unnamed protein product, partial [Mesorhabditis belari]|uniref:Uncharacterized protein n=1 Tax=Mesorhabditis belari TaxID=2138241 RepID=A0AAF3JBX3_9BILA